MIEKSKVGPILQKFNTMIQNQFQPKIRVFWSENALEYFDTNQGNYLKSQGIVHQSSCVDTPQQNGVSEGKNRHLLEVARSIMFTMNVAKHFLGEAILTSTYLINRMPSKTLQFQTPFQKLIRVYPNTQIMSTLPPKIFGCTTFVHIHQHNRSKLKPKANKCLPLGYSPTQKGYKCHSLATKKFYVTLDVTFFKNQPFFIKNNIQGENTRM